MGHPEVEDLQEVNLRISTHWSLYFPFENSATVLI